MKNRGSHLKDSKRNRGLSAIAGVLKLLLSMVLLLSACQYVQVKIYHFPEPAPFRGDSLYNPYQHQNGNWLKSNYHAHTRIWGGLTNGEQKVDELVNRYREFGYKVASVSNYQSITREEAYNKNNIGLPAYEHGVNITKTHHLVLGAEEVCFYDILFWKNTSMRQYLLERVKEHGGLVCINHPSMRNGHPPTDFSKLTGYHFIEVINKDRIANHEWDSALSAGKPVWLLSNDDCHDVFGHEFVRSWTWVNPSTPNSKGVLEALSSGNSYGVRRKIMFPGQDSLRQWIAAHEGKILDSVTANGQEVSFYFNRPVDRITLFGQNGVVKSEAKDVSQLQYLFKEDDHYIRAEIEVPGLSIYLNPVIRFEGTEMPSNPMQAQEKPFLTIIWRLLVVVVFLLALMAIYPKIFRVIFRRR